MTNKIERPLDSDELGAKGEAAFAQICADARLICNSSRDRDRSGWDFIVEFRIDHSSNDRLDARRNPLSTLFQCKTMWEENNRIKTRLSSIERLAKDPKPSFIYVLKVRNDLTFASARLIHMLDRNLSKVLKSLRKNESEGKIYTNDIDYVLYPSTWGVQIEATGKALREAIEQACGTNTQRYTEEKARQLKEAGYDPKPHDMKMTLAISSKSDLVDAFLGIKKEIPAVITERGETRFGIRLKSNEGPIEGIINFIPVSVGECDVVVRNNRRGSPATLSGGMYFPPRLVGFEKEQNKCLIRTPLVDVIFKTTGITFVPKDLDRINPKIKPSEWASYFQAIIHFKAGGANVEVRPRKGKRFQTVLNKSFAGPDDALLAQDLKACSDIRRLLHCAAVSSEPVISYQELISCSPMLALACDLIDGSIDQGSIEFLTEIDVPSFVPVNLTGFYVNYITINDDLLVWTANVDIFFSSDEGRRSVKSSRINFFEIVYMNKTSYQEYINDLKASQNPGIMLSRNSVPEIADNEVNKLQYNLSC